MPTTGRTKEPKIKNVKRKLWRVFLGIGIALWVSSFVWLFWLMGKLKLESLSGWSIFGILFVLGGFLTWVSCEILFSKYEFLPPP